MTTYTADDFARADFARHPDGGLAMRVRPLDVRPWETGRCYAADATMALTGWVPVPLGSYTRHESPDYADGGMAAAAIEKEAERVELADDPDYWHAKFCEARQEQDELRQTRRRLLGKVDQLEVKLRNSGSSGEQPRALTAREHLDAAIALMDAKR